MAEQQIANLATRAAPLTRTTKDSEEFELLAVNATFNGTGAAGDFLPCVEVVSDAGLVVARNVATEAVAAGDSVEVTFAPFLGRSAASSTGGIQFDVPNVGGSLDIETTTGRIDLATDADDIALASAVDLTLHADVQAALTAGTFLTLTGPTLITATSNGNVHIVAGSAGVGGFNVEGDSSTQQYGGDESHTVTGQFLVDSADITLDGPTTIEAGTLEVKLPLGETLTVFNHLNAPIFRVDEDGDLHGLTGKALVFDL